MEPLTQRQQDILTYIADFQTSRGTPPLLREVASAFSLSLTGVRKYVALLRRKGYLAAAPGVHRGLRLTRGKREWKVQKALQGDFERRVGVKLRGATDLESVLRIVREEIRAWLDVGRTYLYVVDPQRRELREASWYEACAAGLTSGGGPVEPRPEAVDAAFRRRKAVVGLEPSPARGEAVRPPVPPPASRERAVSVAAVPLPGRDHCPGVLRLDEHRPGATIDEVKVARAAMAAAALSPALERAALNEDLRRRMRMQAALFALCRSINTAGAFRRFLEDVHGVVAGLVDAPYFAIAARDDAGAWWVLLEADTVDGRTVTSRVPVSTEAGGNVALRAIGLQAYFILNRTPEEVRALEAQGLQPSKDGWVARGNLARRSRSILFVPLNVGGRQVGYISAQSYRYNAYSIRDAEDLILVGEYIGMTVQNAMREEMGRARREVERAGLDRVGRELERMEALEAAPLREAVRGLRAQVAAWRAGPEDPARFLLRGAGDLPDRTRGN